jgi:formamidopyrimidine-DNA glycosylase
MPELPEVETVRRTLAPAVGATVVGVWDSGQGLHMHRKPPRARLQKLIGGRISALRRHGKYLLIDVEPPRRGGGAPLTLLVHLGMTGRLLLARRGSPRAKHTHVVLDLGTRELRFVDARRFGQIDVFERAAERRHEALAGLGPDALDHGVDAAALLARARGKRATLKAFVLDQGVIAGIGNIYASEALWRAGLRPTTRAHKLTRAGAARLAAAIREVLDNALEHNGTSLRDFVDAAGTEGENADYLWVYGRENEPCPRCKTRIRRSVVQGRATYYCPTCQPA